MNKGVTLVEVGPRDGFQPIVPFIPTESKIEYIRRLFCAGLERVEATAFVSDRAVPQMADAGAVLEAAQALPGIDLQVLVPSARYCEKALRAGARRVAFVLSVSEAHNISNVKRAPPESVEEYRQLVQLLPAGMPLRLNLATSFDCPFEGPVTPSAVLALLEPLLQIRRGAEIALCDTTGRATPDKVERLFSLAISTYPEVTSWVFHGHDTYGLGVANVLAAYKAGVRIFDASFAGLGGCPFAPGATGNVATEDVVWTFEKMGIATGVDLDALLAVARDGAAIAGASAGGRVRAALAGSCTTELAA